MIDKQRIKDRRQTPWNRRWSVYPAFEVDNALEVILSERRKGFPDTAFARTVVPNNGCMRDPKYRADMRFRLRMTLEDVFKGLYDT